MNEQTIYPFDQEYDHYVLIEIASMFDPYDHLSSQSDADSSDFSTPEVSEVDRLLLFLEQIEDDILVSRK